jgi:hypothetical protein
VQLLVEQIKVDRNEDGHTQVQITYRFGPPEPAQEEDMFVGGVQNSGTCGKAKNDIRRWVNSRTG